MDERRHALYSLTAIRASTQSRSKPRGKGWKADLPTRLALQLSLWILTVLPLLKLKTFCMFASALECVRIGAGFSAIIINNLFSYRLLQ